ncbi:MAG: ADP-ribosylglycohydrolase family protein [Candidatus Thorarchaeota archaeon]
MKSVDYLDKFSGTLMGVSIGDTLGHPFEGIIREGIYSRFKDFSDYLKSHVNLFNTYTDDTQLTLHTALALIQGNGFDVDYFINEYVKWLDDPPIGPGYGCLTSIRKLKYGFSWKEAASNSGGNGTAMRISPIGLYYSFDIDQLIKVAISSSRLTHSHPAASAGAIVIARAVAYLIDKIPDREFSIDEFFETIISAISNSEEEIWREFIDILKKVQANLNTTIEAGLIKFSQIGVKSPYFLEQYLGKAFVHPYTLSTVACTIFIFLKNLDSFENCIFTLATAGGDSDTVGAIGGSLAGAYFGLKNIPTELLKLIKNYKYIIEISEKLYNSFKKRHNID